MYAVVQRRSGRIADNVRQRLFFTVDLRRTVVSDRASTQEACVGGGLEKETVDTKRKQRAETKGPCSNLYCVQGGTEIITCTVPNNYKLT